MYGPHRRTRVTAVTGGWRRMRGLAKGLLSVMACGALVLPTVAAASDAPASTLSDADQARFDSLDRDMRRAYSAARVILQDLPHDVFSVAARQGAIGTNADALFAWVRDETRWIPYRGTLRGPQGVLMDRMGSHLDRSLLLAALLESAGHSVRLAHTALDDAEVEDLARAVSQAAGATGGSASDSEAWSHETVMGRLGQVLDLDAAELRLERFDAELASQEFTEQVVQQSATQGRALTRMLGWTAEMSGPTAAALSETTRAALRDHWWVQVETDAGWRDLDPSIPAHAAGERAGAGQPLATYALAELPNEQRHTLRIEVVAEQFDAEADELVERLALSHELFAAELTGRAIELETPALDLPDMSALTDADGDSDTDSNAAADLEAFKQQVLAQDSWMPLLHIGGEVIGARSVLADGRVNDNPDETPQSVAAEQAVGMLGRIQRGKRDEPAPAKTHLTAVFLRLTVAAPGREPEQFQRPLMDVLGPALRQTDLSEFEFTDAHRTRRAMGMLGQMRLLGQTGWIPETYMLGRSLHGMLQNRLAVLGTLHAFREGDTEQMTDAVRRRVPQPGELLPLAHHRQALSPHRDAVMVTRLNLLGSVRTTTIDGDALVVNEGFDIIQNAVDVLPGTTTDPRHVRLTQGVLETVLEAQLIATDGPVVNTSEDFSAALARGESWQVIADLAQLDALAGTIDADMHERLRQALARGQTVVVPRALHVDRTVTWWRVDPPTGAVLGIGQAGRGSAVASAILHLEGASNAIGAAQTVQSIWGCLFSNAGDNRAVEYCVRRTAFTTMVGTGFGKLTGGLHILDQMLFGHVFGEAVDAVTPNQ